MGRSIYTTLSAAGMPIAPVSPLGIYTSARALDRVPNPDGSLPPLEDVGSMPNQAMRAITELGAASLKEWPFIESMVNAEPMLGQLESASEFRLAGQYLIQDAAFEARMTRIKQAIVSKVAVCVATECDHAFEDNTGEVITAPTGELLGGHYICILGYEVINRKTYLEFGNSWSKEWGSAGFGVGDEAWARQLSAMYLMNVRRVP